VSSHIACLYTYADNVTALLVHLKIILIRWGCERGGARGCKGGGHCMFVHPCQYSNSAIHASNPCKQSMQAIHASNPCKQSMQAIHASNPCIN
jgi:hypothetical protein